MNLEEGTTTTEVSATTITVDKPKAPKLDIKRITLIGMAFLAIQMFWQVYDTYMPLFLLDFNIDETMIGFIMALDNILALLMLPIIGLWSDNFPGKLRNKFGRRVPFIVVGSIAAAAIFIVVNIAHINQKIGLMICMTVLLVLFMNLYRTPAVSLMPDITPKRVRSGANAIINILGAVGMALALVLSMIFKKSEEDVARTNQFGLPTYKLAEGSGNWVIIGAVCAALVIVALIFVFFVKENKFVKEKNDKIKELGLDLEEIEPPKERVKLKEVLASLAKSQKFSLLFILLSVALWYFAYNAMGTWFSSFWFKEIADSGFEIPMLIGNVIAFAMFVPAVAIGKKFGRKKTVLFGVILMIGAFALGTVLQFAAPSQTVLKFAMYAVFALVGAGWATINVHSFVMSVEMANERTNGVFTGFYYAFAMGAQVLTPIISGAIISATGLRALMPYALVFSVLAFLTMLPVKHGNVKSEPAPTAPATTPTDTPVGDANA
ncbi:MAG: MFS transporter [Firmicutes bacterium]|nr:MFS transporter [Bacillota bacterium]